MLIVPVVALGYGPGLTCDVCHVGLACAAVLHARGHFLVCTYCCGNIAAALVVRVAFKHAAEHFDFERLA